MNEDRRLNLQTTVRDSFVVRIWRERDRPGWQGWVQHTATGESVSVRSVDDLLAFIECRTGRLDGAAPKGLR
jgi:hypothetical protein